MELTKRDFLGIGLGALCICTGIRLIRPRVPKNIERMIVEDWRSARKHVKELSPEEREALIVPVGEYYRSIPADDMLGSNVADFGASLTHDPMVLGAHLDGVKHDMLGAGRIKLFSSAYGNSIDHAAALHKNYACELMACLGEAAPFTTHLGDLQQVIDGTKGFRARSRSVKLMKQGLLI